MTRMIPALGMAALFTTGAQASLLIDDFQTAASVTADDTPMSVVSTDFSGTDLAGADRTITANSNAPTRNNVSEVLPNTPDPGEGVLSVSLAALSGGGTTTVLYDDFGSVDFTASGTALIIEVLGVDLGVSLQATVNSTSMSPVFNFDGMPGTAFVLYNDFSDPSQLTMVQTLEISYTGTEPWDGVFAFLRSDTPPSVPVPATLLLMGLGLAGIGWSRARKA